LEEEDDEGMKLTKPGLWIAVMTALAIGAALYVLLSATQVPASGWQRFATGDLAGLEVRDDAPPLPARSLKVWQGEDAALTDLKGQVIVLNLWATWCAPCVEEMPSLNTLAKDYADRGVVVVPVSLDRALAEAAAFYTEFGLDALPLWGDNTMAIGSDINAAGVPTTIIYNRQGQEVARLSKEADWAGPAARALIDEVLAQG
jgi:thiol-disulfide isomerase/thioredoxin